MDDEIVITGIAGRYPECDSFDEFKEALLNGVDMITVDSRRWEPGTYDLPIRTGKINNIEYFDAGYFGVSPRQADLMDPRHRVMFETAFEAIVDSGYNPKELRGTKTGVYVGIGGFDNAQAFKDLEKTQGYAIIGSCLNQIANRTSYCFDFKGPSFVLDTACSSGLYAFANAVKAMESGDIESAIVSAVSINLHPHESREFNLLNMMAPDGKCKVFCTNRDGYARSEAIITVLLQRKSKCRRLYSTVKGAEMSSDGWKIEGITYPSAQAQLELINSIFKNKNLNPNDVAFVEMHGTGTPAGDINECKSIAQFFCQSRKEPLPVGAVKSNMGHSEISAGLCSLSKVIVAMETGIIPANLHCENLDYSLPGLVDGKLEVVTKNLPWKGGMVALNCFGFGGANSHVVLKSNEQSKLAPKRLTHRLINVSGRTEESVKYYLENVLKHQNDQEFLTLIDEIHKIDVDGHSYRGYSVLGGNPTSQIKKVGRDKRPIWFVYSGMGSQWTGMSKDLMKIDVFRNTIKRCANALKPYDVDLEHILTSDDPTIFDNIGNCFTAIAASEIALTDVIKSFGIEPDGFVGHSLGEVGCAYCNGDLTPEEAMLIGFARGYATLKSNGPPGQMAAVGMSKQEIAKILPENVFIACVNGKSSVTISGLKESVQKFVASLTEKGIFAREVATTGIAFHSKYIADASPYLRDFVAKVITDPKPRSPKWISSSRPECDWNKPEVKLNSADYHCNNYQNPVLFDQVLEHIPKDAILVEIAPHGLLTSVLKREMGPDVTCLSLANKNSKDNFQFLLSNIGQIFINGGQPNLRQFYPDVTLPVGRGTQNIGSMIKWDHSIKWFTPYYEPNRSFGKKVTVNTSVDNYSFLKGHNVDGRVLMAATGYLELVWKLLANINTKGLEQCPVVFESVKFLRATVLPDGEDVSFYINIMKQSGYFEIFEGGSVCCSGTVRIPKKVNDEFKNLDVSKLKVSSYRQMTKHDVYKWFHLKRYMYAGLFQGIEAVDVNAAVGKLNWNDNFTSFLDTMLQIPLILEYSSELFLPTRLQKLVIDPIKHLDSVGTVNNGIPAYHDKNLKVIRSGGVEITNLEVLAAPKRQRIQADPILENYVFVPFISKFSLEPINVELSLRIALQIVLENFGVIKTINVQEIVNRKENSMAQIIIDICKTEPLMNIAFVDGKSQKVDLIVCSDGHFDQSALGSLTKDGFVLYFGFEDECEKLGLSIVYQNSFNTRGLFLLRHITTKNNYTVIDINTSDFTWMDEIKLALKQFTTIYVTNEKDDCSGILGLVKCINIEPIENSSVKCILFKDRLKEITPEMYEKQLNKQLTVNVISKGIWGSYRHIPITGTVNIAVPNAYNYIQTIGDLTSLKWVEKPNFQCTVPLNSEYVYVHYAALNFKDVMIATGKIASEDDKNPSNPDVIAGLEYSGVTKSGKRIMGIGTSCVTLQLWSDPVFTWEIPQSWSLEEAATIPVVYATCYYGLIMRGQLHPGESILIHAGAGGIGIAAISIALSMNCEIFTTVGSQEKRDFLLQLFPKLKAENIGNSRNTSFEDMIMNNTEGAGVDVVLNSLSADLFQASIRCVARRGRFVEIGKVDLWAGTPVSANLFSKNTSFHGVFLDDLFTPGASPVKHEINRLIVEGVANGVIKPLPATIFPEDKVEDAYRFLSTGKHKGKVLIKIRDEKSSHSLSRTIKAVPRIYFHPEKVYVLVGGLGGFGLELANFLIKRCARKIVLNSRRGWTNGYQSLCFKRWNELDGVTVKVNTDDTSTIKGAQSLVNFAETLGPVGGVFNMALVLEDGLFVNQTSEKFKAVFKAKTYSCFNMDQITRSECPKLDHFVVFSSIACGRGNPGQSNYGMANSALERLCEKRRLDGLPGLAVQYGPVGEVGFVAESIKFEKTVNIFGLDFQAISSCIDTLERFMLQPYAVGSTFVLDEENVMSLNSTKSPVETVAHILGIRDLDRIDRNQVLSEIGLDSLMSAEIKQTLYRNFNIEIAVEDLRDLTFNKIEKLSENSDLKDANATNVITNNGVNTHNIDTFNYMLSEEIVIDVINDKSLKKVFFLPPIEGHLKIVLPLAAQLKANVYGLQFTKEIDSNNLTEFAKYFTEVIRNLQKEGPYFLCGYSYGCAIVFEIALELEKQNEEVKLFLIDGTPSFVERILREMFLQRDRLVEKSRFSILQNFMSRFEDIDSAKAEPIISESMDLNEQLDRISDFVSKNTNYNAQDVWISADRLFKRIQAGFYYKPTGIFCGEASLVRSDDVFRELPEDYGLQEICKHPIKLEKLKGDHKQILLGVNSQRIAELINNQL